MMETTATSCTLAPFPRADGLLAVEPTVMELLLAADLKPVVIVSYSGTHHVVKYVSFCVCDAMRRVLLLFTSGAVAQLHAI